MCGHAQFSVEKEEVQCESVCLERSKSKSGLKSEFGSHNSIKRFHVFRSILKECL